MTDNARRDERRETTETTETTVEAPVETEDDLDPKLGTREPGDEGDEGAETSPNRRQGQDDDESREDERPDE